MRTFDEAEIDQIVEVLGDESRAASAATFPGGQSEVNDAGLYSWWADAEGLATISHALNTEIPALIYVGQAGATRWPSGTQSSATLASRIRSNHLNGNSSSSTFRLTVSALLLDILGLSVAKPGRLIPADRARVSEWIREHLRIVTMPFRDRDALEDLEDQVLIRLDPPLNLRGMPPTLIRGQLTDLRRRITSPQGSV